MQDKLRIESEKFLQIEMQEEKNIERRESAEKNVIDGFPRRTKLSFMAKKHLSPILPRSE